MDEWMDRQTDGWIDWLIDKRGMEEGWIDDTWMGKKTIRRLLINYNKSEKSNLYKITYNIQNKITTKKFKDKGNNESKRSQDMKRCSILVKSWGRLTEVLVRNTASFVHCCWIEAEDDKSRRLKGWNLPEERLKSPRNLKECEALLWSFPDDRVTQTTAIRAVNCNSIENLIMRCWVAKAQIM